MLMDLGLIFCIVFFNYFGHYFWGNLYGMGYPWEYFLARFWVYFLVYLINRPRSTLGIFFGVFWEYSKKSPKCISDVIFEVFPI